MENNEVIDEINIYREVYSDNIQCVFNILSNLSAYKKEPWYGENFYDSKGFLDFLYNEDKMSHLMYNKILYNDDYIAYSSVDEVLNGLYSSYYLDKFSTFMNAPEGIEKKEFYVYISDCLCNHMLAKYIVQNEEELNFFFEENLYEYMCRHDGFDLLESECKTYDKYFEKIYDNLKIYYLIENKYNKYNLKYDRQIEMQKKEDKIISIYKESEDMMDFLISSDEKVIDLNEEFNQYKKKKNNLDNIFYSLI